MAACECSPNFCDAAYILRICEAFHITPDEVLTMVDSSLNRRREELLARLNACSEKDRDTALRLLETFLTSLT